jgi:hypothetical protein
VPERQAAAEADAVHTGPGLPAAIQDAACAEPGSTIPVERAVNVLPGSPAAAQAAVHEEASSPAPARTAEHGAVPPVAAKAGVRRATLQSEGALQADALAPVQNAAHAAVGPPTGAAAAATGAAGGRGRPGRRAPAAASRQARARCTFADLVAGGYIPTGDTTLAVGTSGEVAVRISEDGASRLQRPLFGACVPLLNAE